MISAGSTALEKMELLQSLLFKEKHTKEEWGEAKNLYAELEDLILELDPIQPYNVEFISGSPSLCKTHIYAGYFTGMLDYQQQGEMQLRKVIAKLKNTKSAIGKEYLTPDSTTQDDLSTIEMICSQFHVVVRQLRTRHESRATLDVKDEYDVQDLMHALLRLHFSDIRPEEYAPSYAGKASRMDFFLKQESIVLELKKTRKGLGVKELSTQLIEDIERYKSHPGCKTLVCFVYDPEELIANPRGIEHDLSRDRDPFPVRVLIKP